MAMPAYEFEFEGEFEYEGELEGEYEGELEGEYEAEQFFGSIASLARRAVQSPTLRRIGLSAARAGLSRLGSVGGYVGGRIGGAAGANVGRDVGSWLGSQISGALPQSEFESEFEGEFEGEFETEANPIRRVYADALMEHLGHAASNARTEAEAEAFLGALVPLAAQIVPRIAPTIMRAAPQLIRGLSGITQSLRSNPQTRPLIRTIPSIVRGTATSLARQAGQGQPVTPQAAVRALAQQTARTVGSPQRSVQAYQRNRALDRRFHGIQARPTVH
jgi:hypothetical protein